MHSVDFEMVRNEAEGHMDAAFASFRALLPAVPEDYRSGLGTALMIVDRALRETIKSAALLSGNAPA